jgi:hypothetical protein
MAWLMLAQAIVAASGPVAIENKEQAKAMTPQALANALLAPGHPPVDVADVAPLTMDAPPPGAPPQFRVVLRTRPEPAEAGFCRRMVIDLIVLNPGAAATSQIARTREGHRLGTPCVGGKAAYGDYRDSTAREAIRTLDALRQRRRISVPVTFRDDMPADFRIERYTDGVTALRAVPLDAVSWAGPASSGSFSDMVGPKRGSGTQIGFYAGGLWGGVVTIENARITHVALRRRIPPPF